MRVLLCVLAVMFMQTLLTGQVNCTKGDCKNGYSECTFPSGDRYAGEFKNGRIHGRGILYYKDGSKYIGNWDNQQRAGKGRMIFANKDEYLGNFEDNQINGEGTMNYASGNIYEGQWLDGKPHGRGLFTYANGDQYDGMFLNGQSEGRGTMRYASGAIYEGEWSKNKRHGQGKMTFEDNQAVQGKWVDDNYIADWSRLAFDGDTTRLRDCREVYCANGPGKYTYRDGSKYVGDFQAGAPHGNGTVYYANGDRYEGGWADHAPNGKGVMYFRDGREVGAIWESGKPIKKLFERRNPDIQQQIKVDRDLDVKIWAVIVGAARYTHMPALRYTDDDAYQIFAFLKSPEGGALPDEQLRVLIDEDATLGNVTNAMRSIFLRADENDVILFYFSGHGLPGSFLPVDYDGYNNKLEHSEIKQILSVSKAKHKLVLADACHSGSILASRKPLNSILQRYYEAFEDTRGGTALMMSSKGEEYSLEDGGLRSGIFSHFLVRGLKGEADVDGNKIVTVQELFGYVHKQVRLYTGNVQTPTLTGSFDNRMPVAVIRY